MEMRWAMRVSAYSSSTQRGSVLEVTARYRMGWSAGFTLVNVGGVGMPGGSRRAGCVTAGWASTAAPSRLLLNANSRGVCVEASEVVEGLGARAAMFGE